MGPGEVTATGALGGAPYGATKRCGGWGETHADTATGTLGGAPYGATKRVRGVRKRAGRRMRSHPLGHSVELPVGPRTV